MRGLHQLLKSNAPDGDGGPWVIAVEGIVVDTNDPEGMHRVKVVIPSIDENYVHGEWVTYMMPFVGAEGYGPVNLPPVESEVLLFGRFGEPYMMFCLSRYNESFKVPPEFADGSRGLKTETPYKLLADMLIEIVSMQSVLLRAHTQADVKAPVVRLVGGESESVRAEEGKVGFLGASPAARQTLPPDATDPASCVPLCNALKHLIAIKFGFAE